MRWTLTALSLLLVATTRRGQAQVSAVAIRDLNFGIVIRGVPNSVSPADPVKSGQFYFSTPGIGSRVRIQFTLPTQLNGPAGATLPISFGTTDAQLRGTAGSSAFVTLNPNTSTTLTATTSRDANVWIGGRVTPAVNQVTGAYSNTITLTITVF